MDESSKLTRIVILITFLALDLVYGAKDLGNKVIKAVNCGGPETFGAYGIQYEGDTSKDGTVSDAGMQFMFANAHPQDLDIYQTERWSHDSFSYHVPAEDGEFVVILKLSEVYFQRSGQKVFHIMINGQMVARDLDIFHAAGGRGYAHDLHIPVIIKGDTIVVKGVEKEYSGSIIITFVKGPHDNPKVNGFAIVRGTLEEMPPTPRKHREDEEESYDLYDYDEATQEPIRGDTVDDKTIEQFAPSSTAKNPYDEF